MVVKKSKKRGKSSGSSGSAKSSKVKVSKLKRIPTGIPGFDNLIQGGFVQGSTNLISGDTGTGKSIFATQFLVNGIERFGEGGVYISFDERKDDVYKRMLQMGWDLKHYEDKGKFAFLEYTPEQIEKVVQAGGGIASDVVRSVDAKRIVIDSITAFTSLFNTIVEKREPLLYLFDLVKKWGCTALLVSESPQELGFHKIKLEEYEVDGDILLYSVLKNTHRENYIEIFKMRGTKQSKEILRYEISERGFIVKK